MDCQHRNVSSSATVKMNNRVCAMTDEEPLSQSREIVKPTITELTKEVRTNILCTVEGCGKILPNTPALNMHLVKSHRIKDGIVNPTVRKEMKGLQKLYCCPIEGCPRGPNRPFSQFSLVKQHFMKVHAEKKYKCCKCNNGYSTEWDLKRHIEDCGKTYQCTCGCPYASRAALLSHIYRTGHEIPTEHRNPPVKKRKMEKLLSCAEKVSTSDSSFQIMSATTKEPSETALPSDSAVHTPNAMNQSSNSQRNPPKLFLLKPKMALVSVPVVQLAHLPVLLPSTDSGTFRSVVLAVDNHGSVSTLQLLPQAMGAVVPHVDAKSLSFKDSMPTSRSCLSPISLGVQVSLDPVVTETSASSVAGQRGRSTSTNIQTDKSYLSGMSAAEGIGLCSMAESSVSSCSQTDISVSAQVLLPVSVETQTFSSPAKATSSAQTDCQSQSQIPYLSAELPYKTRQTQTYVASQTEDKTQDQAIICSELFAGDSLSVSTQTALDLDDTLSSAGSGLYQDSKAVGGMCYGVQTHELNTNSMADNQTQTMTLLNDLENILSDTMSEHQVLAEASASCGSSLVSVQEQHSGIDFDLEEFLNAGHIQTQTEESELGGLGGDTPLESLDIQTQTDFLLMDELDQNEGPSRTQASDLELFDTQTQTDLNFLLNAGSHMPLSSILRHSSFSMSTESSDTETQTDMPPYTTGLPAQAAVGQSEHARLLNSTETQTVTSQAEGLGHLFLTSNETQTVMDDFLSADLAWNMESHFSSVETQTCEELCALFHHPEKPNR